jgi:hypothetical protein
VTRRTLCRRIGKTRRLSGGGRAAGYRYVLILTFRRFS